MPSNVLSTVKEALSQLVESSRKTSSLRDVPILSFAKGDWFEDSDIIVVSETFKGKTMAERVDRVRSLAADNLVFEILTCTSQELKEALVKSIAIQDASTYWKKIA